MPAVILGNGQVGRHVNEDLFGTQAAAYPPPKSPVRTPALQRETDAAVGAGCARLLGKIHAADDGLETRVPVMPRISLDVYRERLYARRVIKSFRSKDTERLHAGERVKRFQAFAQVARRKLRMLDAATELRDLGAAPGNRLEALRGNRQGQYSIRINDQWRICFVWRNGDAYDVEIVDYH